MVCFCFLVGQKAGDKDTLFHEQNLIITVSNLFAAGTDTTSTTLRWCLLLMAKYPQVQGKILHTIANVYTCTNIVHRGKKNYTRMFDMTHLLFYLYIVKVLQSTVFLGSRPCPRRD